MPCKVPWGQRRAPPVADAARQQPSEQRAMQAAAQQRDDCELWAEGCEAVRRLRAGSSCGFFAPHEQAPDRAIHSIGRTYGRTEVRPYQRMFALPQTKNAPSWCRAGAYIRILLHHGSNIVVHCTEQIGGQIRNILRGRGFTRRQRLAFRKADSRKRLGNGLT